MLTELLVDCKTGRLWGVVRFRGRGRRSGGGRGGDGNMERDTTAAVVLQAGVAGFKTYCAAAGNVRHVCRVPRRYQGQGGDVSTVIQGESVHSRVPILLKRTKQSRHQRSSRESKPKIDHNNRKSSTCIHVYHGGVLFRTTRKCLGSTTAVEYSEGRKKKGPT